MLTIKYEKCDSSVYIANVDLLRVHMRTLRRAKIAVAFSQGFNPHMLIYMSAPIPNGINSMSEYVTVDTKTSPTEFMQKYNANCIASMKALAVYETEKNPNVAGSTTHSEYVYDCVLSEEQRDILTTLLKSDTLTIEYLNKGEKVSKDVRSLILNYKITDNTITFILCAGVQNLRIDRLLKSLTETAHIPFYPSKILKTKQFATRDGQLTDMDEYLKSL